MAFPAALALALALALAFLPEPLPELELESLLPTSDFLPESGVLDLDFLPFESPLPLGALMNKGVPPEALICDANPWS